MQCMLGTSAPSPSGRFPIALRPLLVSVTINLVAPAVVYRLAAPGFPAGSLTPLILSGLPVAIGLAVSLARLRAMDFLALFAAENVVVDLAAALTAHDERQALLGRALENPILALLFLGSLATSRPLVQRMARQLSTGNNPQSRAAFDAGSSAHTAAYRTMTWAWAGGLLVKGAGAAALALHLGTQSFLLINPLWGLTTDALLVAATVAYGAAAMKRGAPACASHPGGVAE